MISLDLKKKVTGEFIFQIKTQLFIRQLLTPINNTPI